MNNLALFFQDAGGGSILWTLLPFVFIFGIFYFLVILPQKKQKQQLQEMIAQLKINDEIVTNGGIIGSGGGGGSASVTGKLDLNAATADELDTLPGVGPVTAQKILAWRAAHGRFRTVAELQEVDGIGPKTYAQLAPLVQAGASWMNAPELAFADREFVGQFLQ